MSFSNKILFVGTGALCAATLSLATSAYAQVIVLPSDSSAGSSQTQDGSSLDPSRQNSSGGQNANKSILSGQNYSNSAYTQGSAANPLGVSDLKSNSLSNSSQQLTSTNRLNSGETDNLLKAPPLPGEFEKYIEHLVGHPIPLFGVKLVLPALRDFAAPATATIPPDYIVQPGDVIEVALSGSQDVFVEREVDTNGIIYLAGVGSVVVAGSRYSDLDAVIARAVGTKFRDFTVSATIGKLRGIRVYVTGFANNPGAFTVSSLSTLANAIFQAGGPNSGGSWRSIKLYRHGQQLMDFDLYQLMRGGSQVDDVQLQNEDVLFIPPAGAQVAVLGSVSDEAIYEAKPGESVASMLAAAGGPNTVGDPSRFVVYHSGDSAETGPLQFPMSLAMKTPIHPGDIIQILSTGTLETPTAKQKLLVRIEGEVARPGVYYLNAGAKSGDVVAAAGGLTSRAFPFGTAFTRQAVKIQQKQSFDTALNQLEIGLASAPLGQDPTLSAGDRSSQLAASHAVLERLRQSKPDGRIVLNISPDAQSLPPDVALENQDAINIPTQSTVVGVFGAVYNPSSFLLDETSRSRRAIDYLNEAGGPLGSADRHGIFVVHANGAVVSEKRGALKQRIIPGDVIFVPVRTEPNLIWARLRDISTAVLGFGVSLATIAATLVALHI